MSNKVAIVFAMCMAFCVGSLSAADECIVCDSNRDANCAVNPDILLPQKCNVPSNQGSKCYARIVNGATLRGCFYELDEAVQNNCMSDTRGLSCAVCENVNGVSGCNRGVIPDDRLRCHSCSENGLLGNCFTGYEANATPCKIYNPDDKCYIRKTEKSIERGCVSDTSRCTNISHCLICDGNGCNNQAGNHTFIPTAPSSATAWTPTIVAVLVTVLVSYALTS